ncbi:hypothetical protein PoB_007131300 [Plakobranchus ocellatus]|uniref:Uncharacterized protein n=1 Tax=Plakobranchus ocellatus TaxID=259542 RepID=A0AAV4DKK6_9GAST|nr:hypothetical protein PoB_007131300 [Plakobranchus ocellatus]
MESSVVGVPDGENAVVTLNLGSVRTKGQDRISRFAKKRKLATNTVVGESAAVDSCVLCGVCGDIELAKEFNVNGLIKRVDSDFCKQWFQCSCSNFRSAPPTIIAICKATIITIIILRDTIIVICKATIITISIFRDIIIVICKATIITIIIFTDTIIAICKATIITIVILRDIIIAICKATIITIIIFRDIIIAICKTTIITIIIFRDIIIVICKATSSSSARADHPLFIIVLAVDLIYFFTLGLILHLFFILLIMTTAYKCESVKSF